jgi:CubicO group peptidase (beta-lactamase class C family)
MRFFTIFLLFYFSFVLCRSGQAQADLLRKEIEKIMRYERSVDFQIVPGVLIGVMDGDSTYRFEFGEKIDPDGVYEMGSVTKPVVAWLVAKALQKAGKDRHALICDFIPDSLCSDAWSEITFDQIIEHQTGLVRLAPGMGEIESDVQDPYREYSLPLLARDLQALQPVAGQYSYSHLGYAMMHWLFEKSGGLKWFTKEHLTHPYLMKQTTWEIQPPGLNQGHGLDGREQPAWNTNALMPALGLRSSLPDMMTFIRLLFFGYESNLKLRKPNALKKELQSLSRTGAYKVVDGWFVIRSEKHLVFYHNGRTGGHHVSIAFTPYLKKGVIIISYGAMGSNELSLLILRMVNQANNRQS